jgi:putative DNA primase/helicase
MNPGKDEEEFEKRLASHLIDGDRYINIDNCEHPIGGEKLNSALTERWVSIRILGKNINSPRVLNTALITANGNNLSIYGDVTRRALQIGLHSPVERPELETFEKEDPIIRAKRERPQLVSDALTVLRAFVVAGRPYESQAPLGSFEEWSGWVRDCLIWLGKADPCKTMERIRKEDPKRRGLATVIREWDKVIKTDAVTVQQLIGRATELIPRSEGQKQYFGDDRREFMFPELRAALLEVAGKGGFIINYNLGNWLRWNKDRVVDGKWIEAAASDGHWRLSRSS